MYFTQTERESWFPNCLSHEVGQPFITTSGSLAQSSKSPVLLPFSVNAALFISSAVFWAFAPMMDVRLVGERCLKVVNCTQVCALMRRVGDHVPIRVGQGRKTSRRRQEGYGSTYLLWLYLLCL